MPFKKKSKQTKNMKRGMKAMGDHMMPAMPEHADDRKPLGNRARLAMALRHMNNRR